MDGGSLKIGRIYGIEVMLHFSWFFIFVLLAWSLSTAYFPGKFPDLGAFGYWAMGIASSLLLFISVLFHELSHSIIALRNKIKVKSITLFFFGGVAQLREDKFTATKELRIAIAGPIFSLSLALLFYILMKLGTGVYIQAISGYLFQLNLILGLFNLVPGYPLDGGRVLRAYLWRKYRNLEKATYIAAEGGRLFGLFMIFFGLASIFFGGFGLWYILLGGFLYMIAKMSYQQTVMKVVLEKVPVIKVMKKQFKAISQDMPLNRFDFDYFVQYEQETFPVMDGKKLMGLVRQAHIEKAKLTHKNLCIGNITIPLGALQVLKLKDDAYHALEIMLKQNIGMLPVMSGKKLVGIVKLRTLLELVNLRAVSHKRRF